MQALTDHFCVVPLETAVERLFSDKLPPRSACVTFDDGYADNIAYGLPILRRYGIQAAFFIATGFLGGGRMWNDTVIEAIRKAPALLDLSPLGFGIHTLETIEQRRATIRSLINRLKYLPMKEREEKTRALAKLVGSPLPCDLMMTSNQVHMLALAGMTIGAHTVTHPVLTRLDIQGVRAEIIQSKEELEAITGSTVNMFAYPNGAPDRDYTSKHARLVSQLGFKAAFSTAWGVATRNVDAYQLPRFTPWDRTPVRFAARLLRNCLRTQPKQVSI